MLSGLLRATGAAFPALELINKADLPDAAVGAAAALSEVAGIVLQAAPNLCVTVDPVERRGFEYQTGVSFTLFREGVRGELGRGGRYPLSGYGVPDEAAAGCTLYMDTLLRALPDGTVEKRIFLPYGTALDKAAELRAAGWIAVAGLSAAGDDSAEAQRLGCSHLYSEDGIAEVNSEE